MIFILIGINQVHADSLEEEILKNHYDSSIPITFHGSDEPILLTKEVELKKQQFRGLYVYTNNNLDFRRKGTIENFEQQYIDILNKIEANNMNAIVFQIRPMNDAFYSSELNPWSRFLSGIENENPGWDPLKWMISKTHDKGVSFYAGFNAYRVSNDTELDKTSYINTLSEKNYAYQHPEQVLQSTNIDGVHQYYLNPGDPEVNTFILDSVMEIVNNYDIDAINLENFYYPMDGLHINDSTTYSLNNEDNLNIKDWRRKNITDLVKNIKEEISFYNVKNNKRIQFGITPYGVWNHYNIENKNGSYTVGYTSFENQYADTRNWIKKGYVDYVAPQIEWEFEDLSNPYADLVKWWVNEVKDTQVNLYIGQDIKSDLNNHNQIIDQLRFNNNYEEIKGSLLFSYSTINNQGNEPTQRLLEEIRYNHWKHLAFHPTIISLDNIAPKAVDRLLVKYVNSDVLLSWNKVKDAKAYIIYRFNNEEEINIDNTANIIKIINQTKYDKISYIDKNIQTDTIYRYIIVTIDEAYNESVPVAFDIDLYPNEMLRSEVIIFTITSSITLLIISCSAFITLRNKD